MEEEVKTEPVQNDEPNQQAGTARSEKTLSLKDLVFNFFTERLKM